MKYVVCAIIFILTTSVYANCESYLIEHIASRNAAIAITGGTVWQVFPPDRDKVYTWRVGDQVMMCYGHMINKVQEDKEISVRYAGTYCHFTGQECFYRPFACCGVRYMGD